MRTDLDHLPEGKRRELAYVVELVREGFAEALSKRTQDRYRDGRILKIILFGSYARGDWVEDPIGRYYSDYDLLIVVNHEDLTDPSEFWGPTERRLLEELSAAQRLRTPTSLIVHNFADVNEQVRLQRPFFADIVRDGVLLFAPLEQPFASPELLIGSELLAETKTHYDKWFESASRFSAYAADGLERGWLKEAAFQLHQAAERLYHCFLLVQALYSPKTHSLNRLRALSEGRDGRLIAVWPTTEKVERRCYELLRAAYVKARYSPHYEIFQGRVILADKSCRFTSADREGGMC